MTVDRIEPIEHGGDLDAARRRYPAAPEPWIDLSTGINPHAYPFASPATGYWQHLPQRSAELALRAAAAVRYGAPDADNIAAAPGTQALIQLLPRLLDPTEVAVLAPTYAEHALCWARAGHRVTERATLADIGTAGIVVAVNPNNPTGARIAPGDLATLAAKLAEKDGLLVVDEAFADFTPEQSLVPRRLPRTVVLRSFGKAYGLAGLRLGFAVAQVPFARRLRAELGPWPVSGPALAIGTAALGDSVWIAAMGDKLAVACGRLDGLLTAAGFTVLGGTHLFRLAEHRHARHVADALGRDGIHVRQFAAHPAWLRFGLPGAEPAWQRLACALGAAARS